MIKIKLNRFGFNQDRFAITLELASKDSFDFATAKVTGNISTKKAFELEAEDTSLSDTGGHIYRYPELSAFLLKQLLEKPSIKDQFTIKIIEGEEIYNKPYNPPKLPEGVVS